MNNEIDTVIVIYCFADLITSTLFVSCISLYHHLRFRPHSNENYHYYSLTNRIIVSLPRYEAPSGNRFAVDISIGANVATKEIIQARCP